MSATHAERTRPDVHVPELAARRPSRSGPTAGDEGALRRGLGSPEPAGVGSPRRSFLPPPKARGARPLQTGGQPPTVIRNLDALFAADHRRRSAPPPAPERADASGVQPLDPARFAQALLDKVQSDFALPTPSAALASPAAHAVRVVPSAAASMRDEVTAQLALDPDDPDLVGLVPWYRRLFGRLFGG